MESTSILEKLSSQLPEAGSILSDSMKRPRRGTELPEHETFRDYLRRAMAEESLTSRQIEDLTEKLGWKVSRSWINLILTKDKDDSVENPGIKTLFVLAQALNRSREEIIAAFLEEPLGEADQLIANLDAAYKKLKQEEDRQYYKRALDDLARSMRRAGK